MVIQDFQELVWSLGSLNSTAFHITLALITTIHDNTKPFI
jgi:hypothetical protein